MVNTLSSIAEGVSLISGREAKIPHVSWSENQNTQQKQYCLKKKISKDFKMVHIKKILKK